MAAENPQPPASDRPPGRKRDHSSTSRQFGLALELPFILVSAIVIGGAFGYFLDGWLGSSPLFLILLGGLGFYAGVRDLLRRLDRESKRNGRS